MEAEIDEDTLVQDAVPVSEDAQDDSQLASDEVQTTARNSNAEAIKVQNNLKARRRTKTGCLSKW